MEQNTRKDIDFKVKPKANVRPGSAFYAKDFIDADMPAMVEQFEAHPKASSIRQQISEIIDREEYDSVFHRDWGDDRNI